MRPVLDSVKYCALALFSCLTMVFMASCQGSVTSTVSSDLSKKPVPQNRVFVLGLDGFTWDLAIPWMMEGKLPNLQKFTEQNVWGNLASVPPYNSPTAWGSAITGVNPGKHGVFNFFQSQQLRNDFSTNKIFFVNSYNYQVPFIWDVVSRYDHRVIAMNVPGSSPVQPLNGIMVAGQPYYEDYPVTYPRWIEQQLPEFRKEEFTYYCEEGKEDGWLKECYEIEKGRVSSMFTLMKNHDWDLFWVVLTSPDRMQHHFWKYMDPDHPRYRKVNAKKYGQEILKIYQYMDDVLGQVMESLPEDVVLILMSDHGFGPIYKSINVADFIFGDENLANIPARMLKVNYNSYFGGAFHINLEVREPNGSVPSYEYEPTRDYLVQKLQNLEDPATGEKVIDRIYRREEIFYGPYSFLAPDIFCEEKPTYLFSGIKVKPDGNLIEEFPPYAISGGHRPNGIFAITGKPIKKSMKIDEARIADMTPTILYLMGLNIPGYMDGKILAQVIEQDYLKKHPPQTSATSPDLDQELLDQLKKLGYIK